MVSPVRGLLLRAAPADPSGHPTARAPATPAYEYSFEGTILELEDQQLLLPDGWVIFPFGGDSGQCVLYAEGEEQRKVSYEAPLERCPPSE